MQCKKSTFLKLGKEVDKVENIKQKKQWHNNIIWILLVSILVMFVGDFINYLVIPVVEENRPYLFTFMSYAGFITMWISVLLAITLFKKNRYILDAIKMNSYGNTPLYLFYGLFVGFFLNGCCALVAGLHGDIRLEFIHFEFFHIIGLFVAVFVQSSAEEVLCRGFIYQRLLRANTKPIVAVVLNAFFFAALHLFNNGMTLLGFYDLFISGVFFSVIVYYFDSLWMAMGIHATWNFTQSILLGLPNSGTSFPYSIYQLVTSDDIQTTFAYNKDFGLEGTILSAILMTVCCMAVYFWKKKNRAPLW